MTSQPEQPDRENQTRVSIVMPTFQQAGYLRSAIDSVLHQQGDFDLELIVIDGGSHDETVSILESYGPRIKFLSEKDEGQADAINKGLLMTTGQIIGWLNSDDLYQPGCLARVVHEFQTHPQALWLYGKVNIIDEQGSEIRQWITAYKNWRMKPFSYARLLSENWISQMGVFWRSDIGRQAGHLRKDLHYTMDYDYWLRLGKLSPGHFVDANLASFRWYPVSKSGDHFHRQMKEDLEVAKSHAQNQYHWPLWQHTFNRWKIVTIYQVLRLFQTPRHTGSSKR